MGNQLYGTWNGTITLMDAELYIGEEEGAIQVQISYSSIGVMHEETKNVSFETDTISFTVDINGFDCPINVKLIDGCLKGKFLIQDMEFDAEFEKISEKYSFCSPYNIIPPQNIAALQENSTFRNEAVPGKLTYELENQDVLNYLEKIGIKTENHHNLETVMELMRQTMKIFSHDGANYTGSLEYGTIAQMEKARSQNNYTNCRGMAILFSGILRAYGFLSSYVECHSIDPEDIELHVVCETWIDELQKYVMIDISNKTVYYANQTPLNLMELRKILMDKQEDLLTVNKESAHNEVTMTMVERLAYFSKNLNYFQKCIENIEQTEILPENTICLAPSELTAVQNIGNKICTNNIAEFYPMQTKIIAVK